ncbi:MAG: hypothetical protein AB7O59_10215 [Pirellulales bacterium]
MKFDWEDDGRRQLECVQSGPYEIRTGDRVVLRPKRRADIMDIALQGKVATVEAIEQDLENRCHLAVVVEDDPGAELGRARQVGHRFFFALDEVEPVDAATVDQPAPDLE